MEQPRQHLLRVLLSLMRMVEGTTRDSATVFVAAPSELTGHFLERKGPKAPFVLLVPLLCWCYSCFCLPDA